MSEASTQFMVGRLSTESDQCNSFNLDGIFGNDTCCRWKNGVSTGTHLRRNGSTRYCLRTTRQSGEVDP